MSEKNLDFDTVINRKNTRSLKYDFAKERGKPEGILPLWVADMDFKVSSYIQEALEEIDHHGIFGYSEAKESYFDALQSWMKRRHDWKVREEWLVKTPGVVYALAMAIRAYTKEGEAVLIQPPVYYPFSEVILDNKRKLVTNELCQDEGGHYQIDFEDFEKKIVEENVKLFLLCNPHNPVGRVWTKEELARLGDICYQHKVIVISDEIHADFIFDSKKAKCLAGNAAQSAYAEATAPKHTVFTNVKEAYREFGIVCTSPSKTFNIAGLQVSNIFIANKELRERFCREINATGYSQLSLPGLVACEAAYRHGEEWLDALLRYIQGNADDTRDFLKEKLPKIRMTELEGTYLVWLDFRAYGLSEQELNERIVQKAGLWLDDGRMFGRAGKGFQRINIACPKKTLHEALGRLAAAFEELE
ncbi:MAG: pyridoxal phosphate-dependent aminotransferase [Lachnospiraceae bacterium]|nr:pyridoxal phosphate-dependent aminotransferase [Lachnospiraceae bacterium]